MVVTVPDMRTPKRPFVPDRRIRCQLAVHAGVDERAVLRAYSGRSRPENLSRIADAAAALGVRMPPGAIGGKPNAAA